MELSEDLTKKYNHTHLDLDNGGQSGLANLRLDGRNTKILVTLEEELELGTDEAGWFDLRLEKGDKSVFLHHALRTQSTISTPHTPDVATTIFANYIAFDVGHLGKDGKVTEIHFQLKGLRDFFHYETIEWHSLRNMTPEMRKVLKKVRTLERRYPREHEFFRPRDLYLTHDLPRVLNFKVADRSYEIHMGMSWTMSPSNPSIRSYPIATIQFETPITIDEAFGYAWEWRRFFTQVAMQIFPFESARIRAKGRPRGVSTLYLPNLDEKEPSSNGRFNFYPGLAPFNTWKERHKLAAVMKGWLEKQSDRSIFRANLERVIREIHEITTPDHVLTLAAGIESLSELNKDSPYKKKDIKTLKQGAMNAAEADGIDVDENSLSNILGLLRSQSLHHHLESLGKHISPLLPIDPNIVIPYVKEIRNTVAHGKADIAQFAPHTAPVTQALAAMCVLWDQKTSGMPVAQLKRGLSPKMASDALGVLSQNS